MFIPPNPNDRPVRERQFVLAQFVVLVTLVCIWSAAVRVALHPETSRPLREFLSVLIAIGGACGLIYLLILVFRFSSFARLRRKRCHD